ncbi:E3 SUMO-protein ligase PIAS4 isoform X5 [Dasypus novemcinctus]|uniref:E3 SUMO-protein ligase PIAS4 isoform X5 n=1 Tax=Dasypus novemcinctus TaxID=9361 RepID=UPI00265E5AFF|nr:E3 SUMO-protein ligase PIAS4 isoform X5 [Dasypus novemcinctus]
MRVQAAVPAVQPGRRGWAWAGAPGRQLMPADLSWAEPEWPGPPALGPVPGVKLPMTLPLLRELGPLPEETSCPQAFFSLKNMVMSFRVSDLQMLLGFVGRSKSGLKHELVTRALQLVQFDCSPELFKKIKELYETRYAKKSAEPALQPHRPLEPLAVHTAYGRPGAVPRTALSGPNIDYPVLYGKCLNGLGRLPPKALKPEVRLVKLPFFNMLDELLKPTELVPQNSEKLQESPCIFALTPRQVELIRNSRTEPSGQQLRPRPSLLTRVVPAPPSPPRAGQQAPCPKPSAFAPAGPTVFPGAFQKGHLARGRGVSRATPAGGSPAASPAFLVLGAGVTQLRLLQAQSPWQRLWGATAAREPSGRPSPSRQLPGRKPLLERAASRQGYRTPRGWPGPRLGLSFPSAPRPPACLPSIRLLVPVHSAVRTASTWSCIFLLLSEAEVVATQRGPRPFRNAVPRPGRPGAVRSAPACGLGLPGPQR